MARLGKLSPDGKSVEPGTLRDLHDSSPERMFSRPLPSVAQLEGTGFVLIEEVARPEVEFGEEAEETIEIVAGQPRQKWTKRATLTLPQAKRQLEAMALQVYWERVTGPAPNTLAKLAEEGGVTGTIAERQARFLPALTDVVTRIQAAATRAAARAILAELEDAEP